jgi:hypothetical protein
MKETAPPIRHDSVTVSPNGRSFRELSGARNVTVYSATGDFNLGINGAPPVPFSKGKTVAVPADYLIDKLEFEDTSGSENIIKFYFGICEVTDATLQIVEAAIVRDERAAGIEQISDKAVIGTSVQTLYAGGADTAEVIIWNYGATEPLIVCNTDEDEIDVIEPGTSKRYHTVGALKGKTAANTTSARTSRFFF